MAKNAAILTDSTLDDYSTDRSQATPNAADVQNYQVPSQNLLEGIMRVKLIMKIGNEKYLSFQPFSKVFTREVMIKMLPEKELT